MVESEVMNRCKVYSSIYVHRVEEPVSVVGNAIDTIVSDRSQTVKKKKVVRKMKPEQNVAMPASGLVHGRGRRLGGSLGLNSEAHL